VKCKVTSPAYAKTGRRDDRGVPFLSIQILPQRLMNLTAESHQRRGASRTRKEERS